MDVINLTARDSGERIDRFLSKDLENLSRSYLQKLLKDGDIRVNGKPVKANYKVTEGDEIQVCIPEPENPDILPGQLCEPLFKILNISVLIHDPPLNTFLLHSESPSNRRADPEDHRKYQRS